MAAAAAAHEVVCEEPVSPTGQYFTSPAISVAVIAVLESEIPITIDDATTSHLISNVFLPINHRFSSIMVEDSHGIKRWKKVAVKYQDHVSVAKFPPEKSPEFYDECLKDYLSKLALEELPRSRPLWEIHVFPYPTRTAAGNLIFKLHHALGDGFSLMGALLSCLQRADDPSKPLTFPAIKGAKKNSGGKCSGKNLLRAASAAVSTVSEFGWSLLKSTVIEDAKTPIRSGENGVEFRPITISTMLFSLEQIKQIKSSLHVSVNDVVCGVVFLGIRLYMQAKNLDSTQAKSTALVLLNTRNIGGYKTVTEMVGGGSASSWGNRFAFLHVAVPKPNAHEPDDPLSFVTKSQKLIRRKRNSAATLLTGQLMEKIRRLRGTNAAARYVHKSLKNTSLTVSNLVGPMEQMALNNHPVRGLYFMVVGVPQNLTITVLSYMDQVRMGVGTENGLIDAPMFKSCLQSAFDSIHKAALLAP